MNWSSGRDAAMALYQLQRDNQFDVQLLLTSVNSHFDRVSMHGLHRNMLEAQIQAIGIPSKTIELPESPSMEVYEQKMTETLNELIEDGFTTSAFGDIFLEDLRNYRETQLATLGVNACFPLWKRDTTELLKEFIELGFRAVIVCLNSEFLDESFLGREIDQDFINDLPANVDPCGENGEFHTFCFDGPIFKHPVKFELGERIFRTYERPKQDNAHCNDQDVGFWFCDLNLVNQN
jgi:uncharacterized protein (TIGR00290 family)